MATSWWRQRAANVNDKFMLSPPGRPRVIKDEPKAKSPRRGSSAWKAEQLKKIEAELDRAAGEVGLYIESDKLSSLAKAVPWMRRRKDRRKRPRCVSRKNFKLFRRIHFK